VIFRKALVGETYKIKDDRISAVEGNRQEFDRFLAMHPQTPLTRSRAKSFFDNNYRVSMALFDGEPIGYVWWTDAQLGSPEKQHPHVHRYGLEVKNGEIYGFALYILPDFRDGGTAGDFFQLYRKQLMEMGHTLLYGSVEKDNLPAVWLHKMHRYEPIRTIKSTLFGGLFLHVELDGGRWYVKNGPNSRQPFDYRYLST
jgi:hypothetical protein